MVGARVEVTRAEGPSLWRRARADGSYASANDPRVLVGLGDAATAPRVRVIWPDGRAEAVRRGPRPLHHADPGDRPVRRGPCIAIRGRLAEPYRRLAVETRTADQRCRRELISGDSNAASSPAPARRDARTTAPIVLPDLNALAESVQRQLRAEHAALAAAWPARHRPKRERAQRYGELGHLLLAATFFDEALLCYRHAEAQQPEDVRWPYYRAHAHVRAGDRASAATAFERALVVRPDYVPAMVWLADMYLDTGRIEAAQATYARALTTLPDSATAHFGAGRAALARGAYDEAIAHLEQALRLDPQASAIHYPLAMAYRATGNRDRAASLLQRRGSRPPMLDDPLLSAAEVTLDSAVSHEGLGMQALRESGLARAIESFRTALALSPGDVSLRYWLATALLVSGDAAAAEREFRAVVRTQPELRARALQPRGDPRTAARAG